MPLLLDLTCQSSRSWEQFQRLHGHKKQIPQYPQSWFKTLDDLNQVSAGCTGNLFARWTEIFGTEGSFTVLCRFLDEQCLK